MSDRPEENRPSSEAAGGWFVPKQAINKQDSSASQQPASNDVPLPDETPQQAGSWYVPPEGKARAAAVAQGGGGQSGQAGQQADMAARAHQPQARAPNSSKPVHASRRAASQAAQNAASNVELDEFGQPIPSSTAAPTAAPADQSAQSSQSAQPAAQPASTGGLADDTGQPVLPVSAASTDQSAAPADAAAAQPPSTGGLADDTGQPVVATPAVSPAPAPLPAGAAIVSDDIDYSNYVPGRGFVARTLGDAATEQATTAAPTEEPLASDSAAQDAASIYTPTGDTGTQAAAPEQPIPAGSAADNDAASLEAESNALVQGAAAGPAKPASPELIHRYEEVERSVHTLRRKYNAGTLTRSQLQDDLRKLMILDQDGYWWMIGLESDRWYKYDGKDWMPAVRPGKSADDQPASSVPSASSLTPAPKQELKLGTPGIGSSGPVAVDDFGLPLPQRVPIVDPGATMVGRAAPRLDNTLKAPAAPADSQDTVSTARPRYLDRASQIGAPAFDGGMTLPSGGAQLTQPNRAIASSAPAIPSVPGGPAVSAPGMGVQLGGNQRLRPGDQPDYGAPPSGILADRQRAAGCLIRLAIGGLFLGLIAGIVGIIVLVAGYYSIIQQYDARIAGLGQTVQSASQSARILDASGRQLIQLNDPNLGARTYTPLSKISPFMIASTIRVEDQRFYETPGFDVIGIARAIIGNLRAGAGESGASGITQQLARADVLDPGAAANRTTSRKIVEIVVASEIARRYTKSQLLEYYLNTVFYGNFSYGVQAAAQSYFGVDAKDLDIAQAAFLSGLVQAPATYDPIVNRPAAMSRFDDVLTLLARGFCIQMEHAPYDKAPFCVGKQDLDAAAVLIAKVKARAFKLPSNNAIYPHFVNYVQALLEQQFGKDALYSGGFTVYTTIDPKVQDIADAAVKQQIKSLTGRNVTNGAVIAVRPQDGAILAMVGSADFNNTKIDGQFNVVTQGLRQPGSSIKPFVYLTAMERDANGSYFTPSTIIWDVPTCFGGTPPYCPVNYDSQFHGPISVRTALSNSINIAAVKTLQYDTVDRFKALAARVGLNFPATSPDQAGLASALGGVEVKMIDMAQGYSVLANGGQLVPLYAITKVTTGNDNKVIFQAPAPAPQQVVEPGLAYLITNVLSDNQARQLEFGNGLTLPDGRLAAVKTGTTNNFKDNWTIGYTPQLVVAAWVGNSDNSAMIGTTGLTGAAPIWKQIMVSALASQPKVQFPVPPTVQQMTVCADYGTQDFSDCPNRRTDVFFGPNPPPPATNLFQKLTIDSFTGLIANSSCPDFQEAHTFLTVTDPTAIAWLNNDPKGQDWAKAHNITLPVAPPPTASCDPSMVPPILQVTSPQNNTQVQGILEVRGKVSLSNFNRYQVEAGTGANATNFQIVDGPYGAQQPNDNSFLGRWDTTNVPNGTYTLRVFAVDGQGHHVQRAVTVNIANGVPGVAPAVPTATPFVVPTVGQTNFGQPGQPGQPTPFVVTATPIVINPQGPTQPAPTQAPPTQQGALPPTNTLRPIFPPTSTP